MKSLSEVEQKSKGVQLDLFDAHKPAVKPAQLELFEAPKAKPPRDPLVGTAVKLPDLCRCGSDVAIIGDGTETHHASLRCRSCNRHRGWLSKFTANWIEQVAKRFGAPEIITLRGPQL